MIWKFEDNNIEWKNVNLVQTIIQIDFFHKNQTKLWRYTKKFENFKNTIVFRKLFQLCKIFENQFSGDEIFESWSLESRVWLVLSKCKGQQFGFVFLKRNISYLWLKLLILTFDHKVKAIKYYVTLFRYHYFSKTVNHILADTNQFLNIEFSKKWPSIVVFFEKFKKDLWKNFKSFHRKDSKKIFQKKRFEHILWVEKSILFCKIF